jgi:hypothetical protein
MNTLEHLVMFLPAMWAFALSLIIERPHPGTARTRCR